MIIHVQYLSSYRLRKCNNNRKQFSNSMKPTNSLHIYISIIPFWIRIDGLPLCLTHRYLPGCVGCTATQSRIKVIFILYHTHFHMMWRVIKSKCVRVGKMIGKNIRLKSRETEKQIQREREREIDTEREMEIFVKILKSREKNSDVLNSYLFMFRHFNKKYFDCLYEVGSANTVYFKCWRGNECVSNLTNRNS